MNRVIKIESHLPHHPGGGLGPVRRQMDRVVPMSTLEKALAVNLDKSKYGVFCEIGAGQEVVRNFFLAGGAAGTIAKSMSAYDKDVSDAIYGPEPGKRYVTKGRLEKMLSREYDLLVDRMPKDSFKQTQYFVFADTVSARSFNGVGECHGWIGIRVQLYPEAEPSQIVLHVRMLDALNKQQQEALGTLGVNLIYATFYLKRDPLQLLDTLLDNIGRDRLEIDQCMMTGAYFDVDQRIVALHLITSGLTNAVTFNSEGEVVTAGDLMYKKDVLVLRGRFRPVTKVAVNMRDAAIEMMEKEGGASPLTLAEVSIRQLASSGTGNVDHEDFLSRVDLLCSQGFSVIVSDYLRFFRLREYINRYTRRRVRFCMSVFNVKDLFKETFYDGMNGGILEAMGRLFSGDVKLYIYPRMDPGNNTLLITADSMFSDHSVALADLYSFLAKRGLLIPVTNYNPDVLTIDTTAAIPDLQRGGVAWESIVPTTAVDLIKQKKLFNYNSY